MLICRTPLRVSLFGGGSDFLDHYSQNSGAVLSFAINKYIYTSIHPLIESKKILLKYSKNEFVNSAHEIEHPVLRSVISNYKLSGIDISVSSDIAAGTGLGSSSAFTVSAIHLIREYLGLSYTKHELAEEACDTEINKLHEPIGKQDQYASAFGGFNYFEFHKSGKVDITPIQPTNNLVSILKNNAILIRVGGIRSAGKLLGAQSSSNQNLNKEEILATMADQATEAHKMLHEGPEYLGRKLGEAWELKKSLSPLISNTLVDNLYDFLKSLGVYGGKLLGAGGSGYFLVFGSESVILKIKQIKTLSTLDLKIDEFGSQVIYRSDI